MILGKKNVLLGSFLSLCFALTAQTYSKTEQEELVKKYPEESCIIIKEDIKYTFSVETKKKEETLTIFENSSSKQFTPNNYHTKSNVVFYDSYSDVTSMNYKSNASSPAYLNLTRGNYQNQGIFHDDVKMCGYQMEMKKGITYDFLYTKAYTNPRFLSKIYFSESQPTEEKNIVFEIPQSITLDILEMNFKGYDITKTEKIDSKKKTKTITYTAKHLKSIPNERSMPNVAKTFPHLIVVVKSFVTKKTNQSYFNSKKDIYLWCKHLTDSVENNNNEFKEHLTQIVGNETDSIKIMEKVFYWIQDHVRYIAFEDGIMGYKPQASHKVYNLLYGDCKGVANLCKQMLKTLKFDARLTWIGTNDIPYSNDLPFLGVYNHMICTVFLKGKRYFLDCTETFISIDDYAERIQGRPVLIENGENYIDDKIPVADIKRNLVDNYSKIIIDGNKLKGTSKLTLNGEGKTSMLRRINDIKSENQQKAIKWYLESENANVTVNKFSNSNFSNRREPLIIDSEFEIKNAVFYNQQSKEILVLPEKDEEFKNFTFDSTRKSDYEFRNKYYLNSVTEISLPNGYSPKYLPKEVKASSDLYDFDVHYTVEGGVLKLFKKIIIKELIIKKNDFEKWNTTINNLNHFYSEAVVLKGK